VYLVFLQTLQLLSAKGLSGMGGGMYFGNREIALLGTFLWAIHPIQTQAITYIVQRQASLAAMFYMIAMFFYILFRQHRGIALKTALFFLSLLFWVLGIFTKQNAVLLPLALLGYEVAIFRFSFRDHRKILISLVVVLAVLSTVFFWWKGTEVFEYLTYAYGHRPFTMWERLLTEPIILFRYLFLILCPLSDFLTLESDIIASRGLLEPPVTLLAVVFITALVLLSLYWLRRLPVLGFALFFFFANHLVESTFIGLELYFEHRNYLPSIFIYFALAYYSIKIILYYEERQKRAMKGLFVILITVFIVSEGNATYLRNDIWKDDISLMEDTVAKAPDNLRSRVSLGSFYLRKNDYDTADKNLRKAMELYLENPHSYEDNSIYLLHYNRGILFMKKSKNTEAIQAFRESLKFRPNDRDAYVNLAYLLIETGDLTSSENILAKMVDKKQVVPEVYNLFGRVLYANDRLEEAVEVFQKALQVEEKFELRFNLIATYLKMGEQRLARVELYKVPEGNAQMVHLLYKALLNPDEENNDLYATIIQRLIVQGVDYCKWIEQIRADRNAEVIYPDISLIERRIFEAYMNHYQNANRKIDDSIEQINKGCPVAE
jgi:tetratricopeptide (TPR) repeat protein